mmetsp:Transcript_49178/g.117113  ORF Transcript_49178/g.117113 Transcript_49178/m.117113 type:complete len:213 (-) Transcript_49178:8-646(-)
MEDFVWLLARHRHGKHSLMLAWVKLLVQCVHLGNAKICKHLSQAPLELLDTIVKLFQPCSAVELFLLDALSCSVQVGVYLQNVLSKLSNPKLALVVQIGSMPSLSLISIVFDVRALLRNLCDLFLQHSYLRLQLLLGGSRLCSFASVAAEARLPRPSLPFLHCKGRSKYVAVRQGRPTSSNAAQRCRCSCCHYWVGRLHLFYLQQLLCLTMK